MAKKVYVGAEKIYTPVEYIQSSGTQYVETGVNALSTVDVDFKIQSTGNNADNVFLSVYAGTPQTTMTMWYAYQNKVLVARGGTGYTTTINADSNIHEVKARKTYIEIDGTQYAVNGGGNVNYPYCLFIETSSGNTSVWGKYKLYYAKFYDNGTLIRDFVPALDGKGVACLFDKVTNQFYYNKGTGTFTAGATTGAAVVTGSVAREVKKMYLGMGNKARRIKKGYIGIGGVARPFIGGGKLAYYGKITDLILKRYVFAATSVGDYAFFGGGQYTGPMSIVEAYNTSLTRKEAPDLSVARSQLAATSVGNYALFAGGRGSSYVATVDAYNTSLTRSIPTTLSAGRSFLAATSVGNYALFGGGRNNSYISQVDAYDTNLSRSNPTALSTARYNLAATSVGNYALFSGGLTGSTSLTMSAIVDAYNTSLTRSTPTTMSAARANLAAATTGDYALFAGGSGTPTRVDAYDRNLTRTNPPDLSSGREYLAGASIDGYALFGGGSWGSTYYSIVDAYDKNLTRTTTTGLSDKRSYLAATTVGNYALFGGGYTGSDYSAAVDAYTIA